MVTGYVPAGVPAPPLDPPQTTSMVTGRARTNAAIAILSIPRRGRTSASPNIAIMKMESSASIRPNFGGVPALATFIAWAVRAVVEIISCAMPACVPSSMTDVGINVHAEPVGSPAQLNISVGVDQYTGVTVSHTIRVWPAATVTEL